MEVFMKLTKNMFKVISDLENIIGSECYNPNSYDGWTYEQGKEFRYPVNIRDKNGDYVKIRSSIMDTPLLDKDDLTAEAIRNMCYRFGSNEMNIGLGLINVLEYLEQRYGLDFNELEKNRKG